MLLPKLKAVFTTFLAGILSVGCSSATGEFLPFSDLPSTISNDMEAQGDTPQSDTEHWGGRGIMIVGEKNSTTVRFDCADAVISTRIKPDKSGNFSVKGLLTRNRPGPIRPDTTPKAEEARFEGRVNGKQMTLNVVIESTGQTFGSYALERDKSVRISRCL